MTGKALLLAVFVPVLVVAVSACGGRGGRLYDATATYRCLTKRPEHHWTVDAPGRSLMFIVGPTPVRSGFPTKQFEAQFFTQLGPGWVLPVMFFGRFQASVTAIVFNKADAAAALYRTLLRRVLPDKLSIARKRYRLDRNLFIDWGTPSPLKPTRAIVLGCLRTA